MLTQPVFDLSTKFRDLSWPVSALYVVVYYKRSCTGVWAYEPEVVFFESTAQVELYLFDLSTETYRDTGVAFTGLVYLKGAMKPTLFQYP